MLAVDIDRGKKEGVALARELRRKDYPKMQTSSDEGIIRLINEESEE